MNVRDLVFGIAWKINDSPLRKADKRTDEFKRSVGDLENEMGSVGSEGKRSFGKIERSANEADGSIRSIQDPNVSGRQPVSELGDVGQEADQTRSKIKSIPDPHIDGSQARDELQKTEDEADQLSDKLGNIGGMVGGAIGGSAVANDVLNFSQIPREFEASLGVTRKKAEGLAKETEDIFANVKDITTTEATESVLTASRTFDVVGEKAGDLGTNIALLQKQTGADISRIARTANLLDERFKDIEGPQQAFNMLTEASQRLNPDVFDELLDNTEEYSNNVAKAGMRGNDFFSAMVDGGEKGIRVMDRMGDSLAFEFIGRIKEGDETVLDSLSTVVAKTQGLGNVTEGTIDEYGKLTDKIKDLKADGEKVPEDLQLRMQELSQSVKPAIEQTQELRQSIIEGGPEGREALNTLISGFADLPKEVKAAHGTNIFGTMYEEQGEEFMPILKNAVQGTYDEIGTSAEDMQKRNDGLWNGILKKVKEGRSALGSVGDAFDGVGEVIGGSLPMIGAFIGSGGLRGVGKVAKGAVGGIKKVGKKFDSFGRTTWNASKTVQRGVGGIGSKIGDMTKKAGPKLGSAAKGIGKFGGKAFGTFGKVAGKVGGLAGKFGGLALKIGGKVLPIIGRLIPKLLRFAGPIGLISSLVIELGILVYKNWDKISSATSTLKEGFQNAFHTMKVAAADNINSIIGKINVLIGGMNKIPKVDIPKIPELEVSMSTSVAQNKGLSPMAHKGVPQLATGGKTKGPTLAEIGEGKYEEVVLPLNDDVFREIANGINNTQDPGHQQVNYSNQSSPTVNIENITIEGGDPKDDAAMERKFRRMAEETFEEVFASLSRRMPRVTEG